LQGRSRAVNLVALQQARIDTTISEYELRGFAEQLVAKAEIAYWECALARRRVTIVEKSMVLAEQQLHEVEQRIKVGNLPETELAAAQAEVAFRKEAMINARSNRAKADLQLLQVIAPARLSGPRSKLVLLTEPAVPEFDLGSLDAHVAMALRMRPDVNQAFLQIQRGDLELVKTRNGLLPKLDVFMTLGDTGYARSFGNSVSEIDGQDVTATAGLSFEFPIRNRADRASHRRAQFTREQTAEAFRNLDDLVRVDVETGLIEVDRTREQVAATATTRRLQEEKLRSETVKFNVGRSTALLVAQAQRDLLSSQVAEGDTVVRHLQALVDLFRIEGSLLERRGVTAPGRLPNRPFAEDRE
jgi:outer membrane protein TolC